MTHTLTSLGSMAVRHPERIPYGPFAWILPKNIQDRRMLVIGFGVLSARWAQAGRPSRSSISLWCCVPQNASICYGGGALLPATLHYFIILDKGLARYGEGWRNMVLMTTRRVLADRDPTQQYRRFDLLECNLHVVCTEMTGTDNICFLEYFRTRLNFRARSCRRRA